MRHMITLIIRLLYWYTTKWSLKNCLVMSWMCIADFPLSGQMFSFGDNQIVKLVNICSISAISISKRWHFSVTVSMFFILKHSNLNLIIQLLRNYSVLALNIFLKCWTIVGGILFVICDCWPITADLAL